MTNFPAQREGVLYLTEGGQETEIMYRHGHDLPEFAMYPLLERPAAVADLRAMYARVLDVAAENAFVPMISGLDYRGSPDWGKKLGYSRTALADALLQSIAFLREVARPYEGQVPDILVGGMMGPRGDAYSLNRTITAAEAEEYHSFQMEVLEQADVDFLDDGLAPRFSDPFAVTPVVVARIDDGAPSVHAAVLCARRDVGNRGAVLGPETVAIARTGGHVDGSLEPAVFGRVQRFDPAVTQLHEHCRTIRRPQSKTHRSIGLQLGAETHVENEVHAGVSSAVKLATSRRTERDATITLSPSIF